MNQPLATKLALDSAGTTSEVSQPVSVQGNNAVSWDATLYALTATNVSFQLQQSNDLENWSDKGTAQTQTDLGFKMFTAETGVTAAYVRLQYTITGSGKAIIAAGMTLSSQ